MTLTANEELRIKEALISFVERVAGDDTSKKMPEEVAALPAVARLLVEKDTTFFATRTQ